MTNGFPILQSVEFTTIPIGIYCIYLWFPIYSMVFKEQSRYVNGITRGGSRINLINEYLYPACAAGCKNLDSVHSAQTELCLALYMSSLIP